ncbi:uncharacterized protein N7498_009064 [Penicillium cinerascens]|uniref:Peptidase M3A/M3B catalytic domain-containing protein n=1 Tax=Penicillium cinerascens TaxID=70096 RepID=A0A9W9MA90_9EURO|nr:uncharacterized protein N7498_009064 [Penicillium cinerascens]KAJ5195626.1 hypothetical protein N7498_009064 [Penicillium cinerascens]
MVISLSSLEICLLLIKFPKGIHDLLGRSKYATFHGHRTVTDFRETPSQLLEYWCWVPECLQMLSCHYKNLSLSSSTEFTASIKDTKPSSSLPDHLIRSLSAAKEVNQAISTLRQIAFSKFDMEIHHPVSHKDIISMNLAEVFNTLLQQTTLLNGPENNLKWGNGYATTPHYIWGQEANYYSYVYDTHIYHSTRMLAADIWHSLFSRNPMSREAGMKYRAMILEPGGTGNELGAVEKLLGRKPLPEAYLRDFAPST